MLNILIHNNIRLQLAEIRVRSAADRQRPMLLKHNAVDVVHPLLRVQRRQLVRHAHGGVPVDDGRGEVGLGPGVVAGVAAVEELEGDGLDADGDADGELERGLQAQHDGVGARLHDLGVDEDEVGVIEDALGDGGDTDQEAYSLLVSSVCMYMHVLQTIGKEKHTR